MRRRSAAVFAGILACAACAAEATSKDDDVDLPDRGKPDGGSGADAAEEGSLPNGDSSAADVVTTADAADGGPCDILDGAAVYCIGRFQSFTTTGTITYGTGFTGPLPAMGLGRPALGYVPANYPFSCTAAVGMRGVPPPNNTAGGKICEVSFDNTNAGPVTGTATYTVQPYLDAGTGDYAFGLTANAGTSIAEPMFFLRLLP